MVVLEKGEETLILKGQGEYPIKFRVDYSWNSRDFVQ
jgi:hypothetical protein